MGTTIYIIGCEQRTKNAFQANQSRCEHGRRACDGAVGVNAVQGHAPNDCRNDSAELQVGPDHQSIPRLKPKHNLGHQCRTGSSEQTWTQFQDAALNCGPHLKRTLIPSVETGPLEKTGDLGPSWSEARWGLHMSKLEKAGWENL